MDIPISVCWLLIALPLTVHSAQIHRCTDPSGNFTYSDVHCGDQADVLDAFQQKPAEMVGTKSELTREERVFLQQREEEKRRRREKATSLRAKQKREYTARKHACDDARDNIHQKRHANLSHAQRWALRMQVHDKC